MGSSGEDCARKTGTAPRSRRGGATARNTSTSKGTVCVAGLHFRVRIAKVMERILREIQRRHPTVTSAELPAGLTRRKLRLQICSVSEIYASVFLFFIYFLHGVCFCFVKQLESLSRMRITSILA